MFEQSNYQQSLESLTTKKAKLQKYQKQMCKVDLFVREAIEPGTRILCRNFTAHFDNRASGPIYIGWDSRLNQLAYKTSESGVTQPLAYLARIIGN